MKWNVQLDGGIGTLGGVLGVKGEPPSSGLRPPTGCLNIDLGGVEGDLLFARRANCLIAREEGAREPAGFTAGLPRDGEFHVRHLVRQLVGIRVGT